MENINQIEENKDVAEAVKDSGDIQDYVKTNMNRKQSIVTLIMIIAGIFLFVTGVVNTVKIVNSTKKEAVITSIGIFDTNWNKHIVKMEINQNFGNNRVIVSDYYWKSMKSRFLKTTQIEKYVLLSEYIPVWSFRIRAFLFC